MAFDRKEVSHLLAECHRRCCICHRFCGVKMETDHIVPKDDDGKDDIENAIPVCFECHAEIHSYNDKHPRGRKFTSDELSQHKEQWLNHCKNHPEDLAKIYIRSDVGPLQSLVDELEFNVAVASERKRSPFVCLFIDDQFKKALELGAISILKEDLKESIVNAYISMKNVNQHIFAASFQEYKSNGRNKEINWAQELTTKAEPQIKEAFDKLMAFLKAETD